MSGVQGHKEAFSSRKPSGLCRPGPRSRHKGGGVGGHRGGGRGEPGTVRPGGGTAFVLSWRPMSRAVPCMWMRPLRAPPSPPTRPSLRPRGWRKAPLGSDGLRAAPGLGWGLGSGPGLRAEHRGASRAVQGVWLRARDLRNWGRESGGKEQEDPGWRAGGPGGGGHRRSFSLSAPVGVRHSWRPLPPTPETRSAAGFLKGASRRGGVGAAARSREPWCRWVGWGWGLGCRPPGSTLPTRLSLQR